MIKKTNISAVKEVLTLFLNLPYEINDFGIGLPFLLHPIVRDRFQLLVSKDKSNIPTLIDVTIDDNWTKIKNQFQELIDKVKKIEDTFLILNKPYGGIFFKYVESYLDERDYNNTLKYVWSYMEYPNNDVNVSRKEFIDFFKRSNKNLIMSKEEKEIYDSLPNEVIVYRGVKPNSTYKALSWTTNLDKALWFADRFEKNGKVYQATINKKYIFTYIGERNEFEVVLDYTKLKDVKLLNYSKF